MSKPIQFEKDEKIYEAEQVPLKKALINITDRQTTNVVVESIRDLGNDKYEILLFGTYPGWDKRFEVEDISE